MKITKTNLINLLIALASLFIFSSNYLFSGYHPLQPEQIAEVINSTQRIVVPLTGIWERSTDDEVTWSKVNVPYTDYETDKVIYRKEIRINTDFKDNKILHLQFLGLAGRVEIYFNSNFVVKLDGKFIPSDIVIPKKMLNFNENNEIKLVFLKNSEIDNLQILSTINAAKMAKGIIREPFVVGTSPVYIDNIEYKFSNKLENLNVTLTCTAEQISEQFIGSTETTHNVTTKKIRATIEYQLINKRTNEPATPLELREFNIENSRKVKLNFNISTAALAVWSINTPELYKLVAKIKYNGILIDEYFVNIAKKSIRISGASIIFNDAPLALKALSYNEHYGTIGNSLSAYRLEEDIKYMKLIGANAIRLQHNVPNPYLVYLCEKYGLLMLIDIPLLKNTNKALIANDEFITQNKNILSQILYLYSKSSVFVGIGIGNSSYECEEFDKLTKQLISLNKNYKKLIYKIVELGTHSINTDGFDFLIVKTNRTYNNSKAISTEIDNLKNKYKLPLVLNAGSSVIPNNHDGYADINSNEYQAYFINNCYKISKHKHLAGILINSYNDYITQYPILTLNYYNQYLQTEGITDAYRNAKTSVSMIKALFNDELLPLLDAGKYKNEVPLIYIIIGISILLLLVFMINRYNRFREYFGRSFLRPYNFFADIRDQRIVATLQTALLTVVLCIIIAITVALCFGSVIYNLRYSINYGYLFTAFFPYKYLLEVLFKAAWQPELLLLFFSLLVIVGLLVNALLIRILAFVLRAKLFFKDAAIISVWTALPFIILLPIGIILAKLIIISNVFIWLFLVVFAIITIWIVFRLFKAIAIIFDKPFFQIYSWGTIFIILTVFIPAIYYESTYGLFPFIEYFLYLP